MRVEGLRQVQQENQVTGMDRRKKRAAERLGAYVRGKYELSVRSRRDLFDTMADCVKLVEGNHEADVDGVDVDANIIAPIVRGVKSLLRDILGNDYDAPFTVVATPVATLPADVEQRLVEEISRQYPQIAGMVQSPGQLDQFLEVARNSAVLAMNREAAKRARSMEQKVKDATTEGGFTSAFDAFLTNFLTYPYAVLKSPSPQVKTWKEWDGYQVVATTEVVNTVENISPFDFGWAPNATNVESSEFLWERRAIGADELLDNTGPEGYDPEMVNRVLKELPYGHVEPYDDGSDVPKEVDESLLDPVDTSEPEKVGYYDAIGFYGRIHGKDLEAFGIEVEDDRRWYEAIVWTINDIPVQATLNPDPAGARPFHVSAYETMPGRIAGTSVAMKLKDVQRVCRATVRALVRNMAYASGVIGEVEVDRLADSEDPRLLQANVMRLVNNSRMGGSSTAYHFHNIDSHAGELMGVFDKFYSMAFELIGIPRIAFGGVEGLGTIGRTSGGIAAVMNQASKTLKDALRNLEADVVVPVVQGFIDWENQYGDDPAVKGDIRAYARGVSGILERETQRERLGWALQSIAPLVSGGMVPQEAVLRLLYALFQSHGIDTEGILPDFDGQAAMSSDLGAGGMPGATTDGSGLTGPPGGITLDGRSANAAAAIENSNSL